MSENTPDYQCPRCMFGYLGFGPSKAWYAGESNNPNLCRKLDGISDASRKKNKLLRHRSEEHTSELQSQNDLVCRLLLEKKKNTTNTSQATPSPEKTHNSTTDQLVN